jgi:muconate cycloisomerase
MNRRRFVPLLTAALAAKPDERIRAVEAIPARVPYRGMFVIGRGLVAAAGQSGQYVYVRVETDQGRVGWGETIALPSWSYETVESICSTVRNHLAPIVKGRSPLEQAYFAKQFDEVLTPAVSQGFPFAKSAVAIATLDLAGQITEQPMHRLFGGRIGETVELSFALSIDKPEAMAEAAKHHGTVKCFKVKVSGEPELDAERVRAVAAARPEAQLWLDANQSYRALRLEAFLKAIEGVRQVRCLEQPVPSVDWLGMKRARSKTAIPLAVDEGCFSSQDVARLARMEAADLVVLKVAKSAGPLGCQKSAAVADANGLGLLGSGLTEAGIGLAASVHLYSTMDLLLPPELNGPKFLTNLWVEGLEVRTNIVTVPDGPGLGIQVDERAIRAHRIEGV